MANSDKTAPITPCDGTANSSRWCCGHDTDCCAEGLPYIPLQQILGRASSSVISSTASSTPTATATDSQTSWSVSPTETVNSSASSNKLSGGAIAGIVLGAVAGLALLAAAIFLARRTSRKKKAKNETWQVDETPNVPATQELDSAAKYAHVYELPGPPPGELQGDTPKPDHTQKP